MISESEKTALSIILKFPNEIDLTTIKEEYFLDDNARAIFQTAKSIIEAGGLPEITQIWLANKTIDPTFITSIFNQAPTAANFPYYWKKLKEAYFAETLRIGLLRAQTILKDNKPLEAWEALADIEGPQTSGPALIRENIECLNEMHKKRFETPEIYRTGLADLDHFVKMSAGNVAIIAARPSEGKTALALQIALNVAKEGAPVAFVSLEMSQSEIIDRALRNLSGSTLQTDPEFTDAADRFLELPFHFISPDTRWPILKHNITRSVSKNKPKLVIVDFVQLLFGGNRNETRANVINEIIAEMKALALAHNTIFVVLSQLNRGAEGAKANLGALRDAGGLEAAADIVLFIERRANLPGTMLTGQPVGAELFLSIEKNRSGQRFKLIPLTAKFETYRFFGFEQDF